MTPTLTTEERLTQLVSDRLQGATLIESTLYEEDPTELGFVVVWRRPTGLESHPVEFGTHRAVLAREGDDAMLIWGHYGTSLEWATEDYRDRLRGRTRRVA